MAEGDNGLLWPKETIPELPLTLEDILACRMTPPSQIARKIIHKGSKLYITVQNVGSERLHRKVHSLKNPPAGLVMLVFPRASVMPSAVELNDMSTRPEKVWREASASHNLPQLPWNSQGLVQRKARQMIAALPAREHEQDRDVRFTRRVRASDNKTEGRSRLGGTASAQRMSRQSVSPQFPHVDESTQVLHCILVRPRGETIGA